MELCFFTARSGEQSAAYMDANGQRLLVHSAIEPKKEGELQYNAFGSVASDDLILAMGCGVGWHLLPLVSLSQAPTLVLCDAHQTAIQKTMELLHGYAGRILAIHPQNAQGSLLQLRRAVASTKGKVHLWRHPVAYNVCQDLCSLAIQSISDTARHLQTSKVIPTVAIPFGTHFLQLEVVHALQELQIPALTLPDSTKISLAHYESECFSLLTKHNVMALVCINAKGLDSEGILALCAARLGISIHVWFVDDPRPIVSAYPKDFFASMHLWCWERAYLDFLHNHGCASATWLPLAADPQIFTPEGKRLNVSLPLAFVGSSMGKEYLDGIRQRFLWSPSIEEWAVATANALQNSEVAQLHLHPRLTFLQNDLRNRSWASALAIHIASHWRRVAMVRSILHNGVSLVGDAKGWQQALQCEVPTLPDVDYRTQLSAVYRSTEILVNSTSRQMPTAVNQRVFDAALTGTITLHDRQPDLELLFAPDEYFCYNDLDGLQDMVFQMQRHGLDQARATMQRAREHVLSEHTYVHRLRTMLANEFPSLNREL